MPITLPMSPNGEQFEDYVAASLRALGYFIETRVTLRDDGKEVLELDVVATPAGGSAAQRELYEAKKAGPKFESLFKLYGQRMYLGIDAACLATLQPADAHFKPVYDAKGAEIGVRVCCHTLDAAQLAGLAEPRNDLTPERRETVAGVAWFLQIANRIAQAAQTQACKSHSGDPQHEKLRDYGLQVTASFFAKTPLDRAEALYAAYFQNPKLTGAFVTDIAASNKVKEVEIWNELKDTDGRLWLQSHMLSEWIAKVSVIKHALDHVVLNGGTALPTMKLKFGKATFDIQKHNLPPRFAEGLKTLHAHPHSLRLPYLYQTFLELCGGFLLTNSDDDLAMVEAITGVPRAEIVPALMLLDEFFGPPSGSMFYRVKKDMLCLNLVPGFVRGVGSFLRLNYMDLKHYDAKFPTHGWLMAKWHGMTYKVLCQELPEIPKSEASD